MSNDTSITLVGNLTGDPELRFTQSGAALAAFTVASTPRVFDRQSGQWQDGDTLFLRCTAWRDLAENVADTLRKGMRVIVQGRLTQSTYERDGQKRTSYDVQVDEVGPSLRYAKAQVERVQRPVQGGVDPWGTQTGVQQAHTLENAPTPSQPPTGWENTPQNGAQQAFPTNPPF